MANDDDTPRRFPRLSRRAPPIALPPSATPTLPPSLHIELRLDLLHVKRLLALLCALAFAQTLVWAVALERGFPCQTASSPSSSR